MPVLLQIKDIFFLLRYIKQKDINEQYHIGLMPEFNKYLINYFTLETTLLFQAETQIFK